MLGFRQPARFMITKSCSKYHENVRTSRRHHVFGSTILSISTLLPSGYLSTSGNQIIDASGNDVRIASVGWNQNFNDIAASVAQIAASGFNTIRLSWVDATLSSDLP